MLLLPSTINRKDIRGWERNAAPVRRASPGPTPCTARKARANASPEPYPYRTATSSSVRRPASTSAPASVSRRRRTYSESGMPASAENIRRKWYSDVMAIRASSAASTGSSRCSSMWSMAWFSRSSTPGTVLPLRITTLGRSHRTGPDFLCPVRSGRPAPSGAAGGRAGVGPGLPRDARRRYPARPGPRTACPYGRSAPHPARPDLRPVPAVRPALAVVAYLRGSWF